jgi:hypothetical protein
MCPKSSKLKICVIDPFRVEEESDGSDCKIKLVEER